MNESEELTNEKIICNKCGSDKFRVYISVIVDDARFYCIKCGLSYWDLEFSKLTKIGDIYG